MFSVALWGGGGDKRVGGNVSIQSVQRKVVNMINMAKFIEIFGATSQILNKNWLLILQIKTFFRSRAYLKLCLFNSYLLALFIGSIWIPRGYM